jgi:hypothetical protein
MKESDGGMDPKSLFQSMVAARPIQALYKEQAWMHLA